MLFHLSVTVDICSRRAKARIAQTTLWKRKGGIDFSNAKRSELFNCVHIQDKSQKGTDSYLDRRRCTWLEDGGGHRSCEGGQVHELDGATCFTRRFALILPTGSTAGKAVDCIVTPQHKQWGQRREQYAQRRNLIGEEDLLSKPTGTQEAQEGMKICTFFPLGEGERGERAPQSNSSLDRRTVEMKKTRTGESESENERVRNEQLKLTIEDFPSFSLIVAKSGIPSFQGQEVAARSEATKIMNMIREKNKSNPKQVNIVVEYVVGAVRDTIQHMIKMYEPSMLVVGTRGRSSVKGFLLGSVSRYLLNHSPVPVTVVRPASKLIKSKTKAKGIFRRRSSVAGFSDAPDEQIQAAPQLFYSSPLSRQTSRASVDEGSKSNPIELERVRSRSPEPGHGQTAAARASAAKRPSKGSIFAPITASTTLTPPSPAASISSSLSFASAMLSDSAGNGNKRPPPPPEGMLTLRKSVTTDGSLSSSSSSSKKSGRRSMGFLWAPLSLGKDKKNRSSEV